MRRLPVAAFVSGSTAAAYQSGGLATALQNRPGTRHLLGPAGDNLDAGKTATTDIVLERGTYLLYCPILDHRDKGESTQITVSAG